MEEKLLYENMCELCKATEKKEKDGHFLKAGMGIYVGETSRSLYI